VKQRPTLSIDVNFHIHPNFNFCFAPWFAVCTSTSCASFFETIALRLDRPNGTEVCALERAPSTSSVLFRQFFQVTTLQSCDFQPHAHFNRTTLTIGRFTGQSFPSSPGVEFALHLFFRGAYAMSSTAR
jgi:hypothetical protein